MTDIYRGFPYQWPGDTPEEKLDDFEDKIAKQVDQVLTLPEEYQEQRRLRAVQRARGQHVRHRASGATTRSAGSTDPKDYFAAWDDVYALIKGKMPDARIAGPNTSILYTQVQGLPRAHRARPRPSPTSSRGTS